MFKPYLVVAGVALLFAGSVQAEAPETQSERARATIAKKEAPAPSATRAETDAASKQEKNEATEELHPAARPVYLNGGYFGDQ